MPVEPGKTRAFQPESPGNFPVEPDKNRPDFSVEPENRVLIPTTDSVHGCMQDCNDNAECNAITYNSDTMECYLQSEANADYSSTAGSVSAIKCDHIPDFSPERGPDSYMWNSCGSQLSKTQNSVQWISGRPYGAFVPQCDSNCDYNPEQCHGATDTAQLHPSTGTCWCVNQFGVAITDPVLGSVPGGCGKYYASSAKLLRKSFILHVYYTYYISSGIILLYRLGLRHLL